jgi:alkylation response protein AidB-like acyl-CoA dehydrogenase
VWRGLAAIGCCGLAVPEAHGGAGGGMVDLGVVLEELGRTVHPGPFLSSAVGAVGALLEADDPDVCADLLPSLADGSCIGTVAFEETGRPPTATPATTARPVDGVEHRLSGEKVWVADAVAADLLVVTAAGDDTGLQLFAVDAAAPGVTITARPTIDGTRRFADVELRDVAGRRIGSADATGTASAVVDRLLVAWVIDGVGAASRALELAVAYAGERVQFGVPIGSFQAVQHLCADMLHDIELARAGAYYAMWAIDAAEPGERHRAATMAKAWASDALARVGAGVVQVFGGIGFTWEHDAHLFTKRLLTLQQVLGGSGHHLDRLADLVIEG